MQHYVGTKLIKAQPMNRQEYNDYRGWQLPKDENGADTGYLVEYLDGGEANHPAHEGYISWSPTNVFMNAYQNIEEGMNFGHALILIKQGYRLMRKGWNGKNMFVYLVKGSEFEVNRQPLNSVFDEGTPMRYGSHIDLCAIPEKGTGGKLAAFTWSPSMQDVLADDWCIYK